MDFETFVKSLFGFLQNSENAYFLLYAVATCLVTQLLKKIFVNKVNVDVLHKFDFAVLLPFVVGLVFATLDTFCVQQCVTFTVATVFKLLVSGATIGSFASVIFKFVASLSGQSMKSLLKSDVFGVFYTQLLYFGNVRSQLLTKQLSLKDFVQQVKLVSNNAVKIYQQDCSANEKKMQLCTLLSGIIDQESITQCVNNLSVALSKYMQK